MVIPKGYWCEWCNWVLSHLLQLEYWNDLFPIYCRCYTIFIIEYYRPRLSLVRVCRQPQKHCLLTLMLELFSKNFSRNALTHTQLNRFTVCDIMLILAFKCGRIIYYTYFAAVDVCARNTCLNGGTCMHGTYQYACTCAGGWTGNDCDAGTRDYI